MSDLGPERMRAAGVPVTVGKYARGSAGIEQSLGHVIQGIRDGRHDADVRRWAIESLMACGLDGRTPETLDIVKRSACLLDALRAQVAYSPDPVQTETIAKPHATLCLRNVCVPVEDCDGLSLALGSAMSSVGIPTYVVHQKFSGGAQEHVLLGVIDAKGGRWYVDPSSSDAPYQGSRATSEQWHNPYLEYKPTGLGAVDVEFVTLGALPTGTAPQSAREAQMEVLGLAPRGLGAVPVSFAQASQDLQNMVVAPMTAADQYAAGGDFKGAVTAYQAAGQAGATTVGPEIDLAGAPNVTQPYTKQAWDWNGTLAAIASATATQADATNARGILNAMVTNYQNAIRAGQGALANPQPGGGPSGVGGPGGFGAGAAVAGVLTAGVLGGLAWNAYRKKRR